MHNLTQRQLTRLKLKFRTQRQSTISRIDKSGKPIIFKLTFDEWLDLWMASGKIDLMGRTSGSYVMSRYNDLGDYEVGNVFIQPVEDNIRDGHKGLPKNRGNHNLRRGEKHTQATKDLMKKQRKGRSYQKKNTPIMTPAGEFATILEAAEYLNITPPAIHYFKRKYPNDWYYVIKP